MGRSGGEQGFSGQWGGQLCLPHGAQCLLSQVLLQVVQTVLYFTVFFESASPSRSGGPPPPSPAPAPPLLSFLCFLCFLCFLSFLCFFSFFFFFFFPPASVSEFLLGDGLPEALLAFLAGGAGEPLAERAGEGEAEPGAGRFRPTGLGDPDLDFDDGLLTARGL